MTSINRVNPSVIHYNLFIWRSIIQKIRKVPKINMMYYSALIILIFITYIISGYYVIVFTSEVKYYGDIMIHVSDEVCNEKLLALFDRQYNYTELLDWVRTNIIFEQGKLDYRPGNPIEIITYGRGKCEEFGIVYTALCLAHGYEARLVVSHIVDGHVWTEVKLDGKWVHVEPADGIIDQPYRRYDRGRQIALVIAYEPNSYEVVTLSYKRIN